MSELEQSAVAAVLPTPVPMLRGTFALYDLPDGGRLIAYRVDGEEESQHIPIPAVLMRMWEAQARGEKITPMQMMKAVMGE